MRLPRLLLCAAIVTLSGPALAQESAGVAGLSPQQIGETFCLSRISGDPGPILGLLTPGLATDLAAAEEKNAAWEKANPGEKPPLGDGTPWSTYIDYASRCEVGAVENKDGAASVEIRYGFPEAPEADYSDWLALERVTIPALQNTAWRIDNVVFIEGGSMRTMLGEMFAPE